MEVIHDVTTCQCIFPRLVLTIGSFDGVHLGHRQILDTVIDRARAMDGTAALMSLWPHPKAFFNPGRPFAHLTGPAEKEALLRDAGIDVYFILPFTADVARMTPRQFLTQIILEKCRATLVVVGHDFSFGADASGDFNFLAEAGPRLGLTAEMVPPILVDGDRVSSTRIRELALNGQMERAAQLLGRPFAVTGIVGHGRGMGAALGYPTANLEPDLALLPAHGIYAAKVQLDGARYLGAVNVGIAPTIPHDRPVLEVHLLDFSGDLAGRRIKVDLYHRLRPEKRFESLDALKAGIGNDVANIRQYFRAHSG